MYITQYSKEIMSKMHHIKMHLHMVIYMNVILAGMAPNEQLT